MKKNKHSIEIDTENGRQWIATKKHVKICPHCGSVIKFKPLGKRQFKAINKWIYEKINNKKIKK